MGGREGEVGRGFMLELRIQGEYKILFPTRDHPQKNEISVLM